MAAKEKYEFLVNGGEVSLNTPTLADSHMSCYDIILETLHNYYPSLTTVFGSKGIFDAHRSVAASKGITLGGKHKGGADFGMFRSGGGRVNVIYCKKCLRYKPAPDGLHLSTVAIIKCHGVFPRETNDEIGDIIFPGTRHIVHNDNTVHVSAEVVELFPCSFDCDIEQKW